MSTNGVVGSQEPEWFALTAMQRGLVAETLLSPGSGTNVEQVVWELPELPDIVRFRAAWQAALESFDALRVEFDWSSAHERTRQRMQSVVHLPFEVVQVEAPEDSESDFVERFLARDRQAGFDLARAPLLRVSLLLIGSGRIVCVWTVHHAIIDGASFPLVLDRVWQVYRGHVVQSETPSFRDFVHWLEAFDDAPGVEHFAQRFNGFGEPTPLPALAPTRSASGRRGKVRRLLDSSAARGLERAARDSLSSPTAVVQLAWALLLSRYAGGTDVVFGATWSGRRDTLPLDPQMRVLPPGSVGQLYIGGAGLALGYLNRKELTERQFVPHPFDPGARLYATGDRVRLTPRGNHVYVDRTDNQVKIRGYRIELGEIEAELRRYPGIRDAAVVQLERRRDVLVGFVASDAANEEDVRRALSTSLPSYMVPQRVFVVPTLPFTSAGKVDRKALAQTELPQAESSSATASESPILSEVLHIWEGVLEGPVADASLGFFDLGGHSLQLVRMLTEVQRRFGRAPGLRTFLENPTAEQLASLLASEGATAAVCGVTQLASGEADALPLFFAPGLTGREMDYVHLARALPDEIPLYGLTLGDFHPDEGEAQPLEGVARRLADTMEQVQSRGPYAIAGYSAGGVCATLIAQELQARGHELSLVGLIDCVPPSTVPIPSPLSSPRRVYRLARTVFGRTREIVATQSGLLGLARRVSAAAVRSASRWQLSSKEYRPAVESYFGDEPSDYTREEMKAMQRYLDAVEVHAFPPLDLDLVLFRTPLDPPEGPHELDLGWGRVTTGQITIEQLPGRHGDLLRAGSCDRLAEHLAGYLPGVAASG